MGRIFVSHSAKEPDEQQALDALVASLEDAEFTVLVDRLPGRLQPGIEWRREIHTWMASCHAAVVLLSKNALQSDWVLKEATVVAWRRSLDKDFVLIPILLDPVRRADLEGGPFRPLALNELQFGKPGAMEEVASRLETVRQADLRLPSDAWIKRLALDLSQIEVLGDQTGAKVIDDAAVAAHVDLEWIPTVTRSERLARRLIYLDTSDVERAVESLADVVPRGEVLDRLIDGLKPVWVDPLAAAPIPDVAAQPGGVRAVAIRSQDAWVGEMYLLRAGCGLSTWRICRANNTGEGEDSQADNVIAELFADGVRVLGLEPDPTKTTLDTFIVRAVAYAERGNRLFAVIPNRSTLSDAQIKEIHDRLKVFTLVLLGDRKADATTVGPAVETDGLRDVLLDLAADRETRGRGYRDYLNSFRSTWAQ